MQEPKKSRARRAVIASTLALALAGGASTVISAQEAPTAPPPPAASGAPPAAASSPAGAPPAAAQPSPQEQRAIAEAERVGTAFAAVAEQVSPSVVSIRVEAVMDRRAELPFHFGGTDGGEDIVRGGGSGFVISADGAILTNRHVVENARRIEVRLADGRTMSAQVAGIDRATDLAVIRVTARGLVPLRFADMDRQRVGQWVVAVGSPFGLDTTVTAGVLSAVGRGGIGMNEIEDYVQTDASINPGNSGGPLVNLDGEVVGVNSMILGRGAQGIGFAIPADMARNVAQQLLETGRVRRAWMGVGFQELTAELASTFGVGDRRGALVNEIVANGPAARAGLQIGDVVLSIDGAPVREGRDLQRQILRRPIGAALRLEVAREGRVVPLTLTTSERPSSDEDERARPRTAQEARGPGVQLIPLTAQIARQLGFTGSQGAVVAEVREGGAADRAGLSRGDVIVEADRRPVRNVADVERALGDGTALLRAQRGERAFFTVLEVN